MKGLDFSWPAAFNNPKNLSMCGLREAERKPVTSRMLITAHRLSLSASDELG